MYWKDITTVQDRAENKRTDVCLFTRRVRVTQFTGKGGFKRTYENYDQDKHPRYHKESLHKG